MLENILERNNASLKTKITVKTAVSVGLILLAVTLPQIAHLAVGTAAGITLLPMYLPVIMGGCLLGSKWGLAVGVASPLVSFLITSLFGTPMPAFSRLPFMMAELAVFAVVSGLFSNKIAQKPVLSFAAVLLAQLCGRAFFLLLVFAFGSVTPLAVPAVWGQIKSGFVGLAIQLVIVPIIVMLLSKIFEKENR